MAEHTHADIELVHGALRPLLMMLGDYHNLSPDLLQKLTHMIELFPTSFNEKMCEALKVGLIYAGYLWRLQGCGILVTASSPSSFPSPPPPLPGSPDQVDRSSHYQHTSPETGRGEGDGVWR